MFMNKEDSRFEVVYKQGFNKTIFKDKNTGVCYLYVREGNSGGLTVLVDSEGKPLTQ